jgi:ribosome-associated toxin RatA of RatAB toxin-antitoxin module
MPSVQKQLLLPFSAEQMFDLVDDIEAYPSFLPWCGGVTVNRLSARDVEASIVIAFRGLSQRFSTLNRQHRAHEIAMSLKDGPFSELNGLWGFKALGKEGCKLQFELQYEFSSRLLGLAVGPVFDQIAKGFVDAFVVEAERRYGA